ncbi:MAG: tRNA (5-methylaminomethyl-2-thiouridine)(34)-methyltransferase MnmD [Pseudomonadota bacterium]
MAHQTADITWAPGGQPVSTRFDDPYFSLQNGLEETRHVFLAGNDLAQRLTPGFTVAELGFGTGLNLLALAHLCETLDVSGVHFTSFEAYPMRASDMTTALEAYPEVAPWAERLMGGLAQLPAEVDMGCVRAHLIFGDARDTLPTWEGMADAWFLDGFSPAKNPELWEPDLMGAVAAHTNPGGTFATYPAASAVRAALADAGFAVERAPGHGRKRHMSRGRLADRP